MSNESTKLPASNAQAVALPESTGTDCTRGCGPDPTPPDPRLAHPKAPAEATKPSTT